MGDAGTMLSLVGYVILFVCVLWLCVWLSLCGNLPTGSLSSGSESVGGGDICESAVAMKQCEPIPASVCYLRVQH